MGWGTKIFCPGSFCLQGGCAASRRCSRRPAMSCRSPHELRLTDSHSVGSDPVSTLPEHVPKGAACQCWLGTWRLDPCHGDAPRSNDPLRCGLNSSPSNITAMRNLPQFAKIPQGMHGGALLLPCSANHVLPWTLGATSLLVAVPRLGGLGHQQFSRLLLP